MRIIILDSDELGGSDPGESLEIATASRRPRCWPFADARAFAAHRMGAQAARHLPDPVPAWRSMRVGRMLGYVQEFTDIPIKADSGWQALVIVDNWDEENVVLYSRDWFIHYLWSTSS